ncbi:MAG: universal stress protein [Desulfobacterales bacterium]|nr:universal stress protein [Desulfobacterales bacterium]
MKIMVCFDGSTVSEEAVRLAGVHAGAFGGKVIVVTSMVGGPEVARREFVSKERELAYAASLLGGIAPKPEVHLSIRGMDSGEDLVRFAAENDVQEMILGVRRRSKVGKLLFGSTAQYVILHAPCPVVTVR